MDDGRRVVASVLGAVEHVAEDGGAQRILHIQVRPAHSCVHHVLERVAEIEAHRHANLEKNIDDARVLANGAVAFRAQAGVGEDLRDGIFRRGRLLALVGSAERADVVRGVVVGDELQRVGDALDEIRLLDGGDGGYLYRLLIW